MVRFWSLTGGAVALAVRHRRALGGFIGCGYGPHGRDSGLKKSRTKPFFLPKRFYIVDPPYGQKGKRFCNKVGSLVEFRG